MTKEDSDKTTVPEGVFTKIVHSFKEAVEDHKKLCKDPNIAIFTHQTPDPDAIGSMMAMQYLLDVHYGIPSRLFYEGKISHPQNITMVQVLNPVLEEVSEYDASQFTMNILVDVTPKGKMGIGNHKVDFDIVIDHHKEVPTTFKKTLLHKHVGSCCTIIHNIIKGHGIVYDKKDITQSNIATALLIGIITDTNFCLSPETTEPEWSASQELSVVREEDSLEEILHYERPMSWVKLKCSAIDIALRDGIKDGIVPIGLGRIKGDQRDILSDIADELLTCKTVNTAVVFALVDGIRIEGAIRTRQKSLPLSDIAEQLAGNGEKSTSGARGTKGGYQKYLEAFKIETDEDEELQQEMWEALKNREMAKVYRVINK